MAGMAERVPRMTHCVVQFSTGVGSAEVAFRAVDKFGPKNVTLLTANTLIEDKDNWRFAYEVLPALDFPEWSIIADGRTPMEVGRDRSCIPSDRMTVCSQELKIRILKDEIARRWNADEIVMALGFDWTENTRIDLTRKRWAGYEIWNPLDEPPYLTKFQMLDHMRDARGIEPPRLYREGFSHANCGGGCVRAGQVDWRRLLFWNRDRFLEWETEEAKSREHLGKDVAILRHRSGPNVDQALTLQDFRLGLESDASLFDSDDHGVCGCT